MDANLVVFLAYPSRPEWLSGSMLELSKELRQHWTTIDWAAPLEPGFIWSNIKPQLDSADLLLAQLTRPNGNVYFELGYMAARGKAVFGLLDKNYEAEADVPPLEPVAHIQYESRKEVLDHLHAVTLQGPTLFEQMKLSSTRTKPGRLYFMPARGARDLNDAAAQVCREVGLFDVGWADPNDPEYDSLPTQARSIAEADLFVALLVNDDVKNADIRNAQVLLYAGIAAGLGRQLVVYAQQPQRRLLDLGDQMVDFNQEADLRASLRIWLTGAARTRVSSPAPVAPPRTIAIPQGPLADLFLGNLDARADAHLADYFVRIPEFPQVRRGERHLVVGAKGSGKTALYEMLRREFDGQRKALVEIAPSNFEFPRLAGILQSVSDAHWEFVFGSFWRFILLTEVVREIRAGFTDFMLSQLTSGGGTRARGWADVLDEWLRENEPLLEMDFVSRVSAVLGQLETVPGAEEDRRRACEDLLQVARMYEVERALFDFSREYEIHLLVDDLDRNWTPASEAANRMLIALLTAVHDLMDRFVRARGRLLPAIFVRRDVYDWLRRNDPEITRRDPAQLRWSSESLERMIAARISARTGSPSTDPADLWQSVFPSHVGEETASAFIISRTHKRPRDVLRFCQAAVDRALRAGRSHVAEVDLRGAWEEAGQLALAQTEKEFETRYPGLGAVALFFFDKPITHRWSAISQDLALFAAEQGDHEWLEAGLRVPDSLLEVLYTTEVLGVESASGLVIYGEERPYAEIRPALAPNFHVHVHPAYRKILECLGNWDARATGV